MKGLLGFFRDLNEIIERNPEFYYINPIFMLPACLCVVVFFAFKIYLFPYIESEQIKIIIHGLLNPPLLLMSTFLFLAVLAFSKDRKKAYIRVCLLIPIIALFGTLLQLYYPWHMAEGKVAIYFTLLPGVILSALLARFNIWAAKFWDPEQHSFLGKIAKIYDDSLVRFGLLVSFFVISYFMIVHFQ